MLQKFIEFEKALLKKMIPSKKTMLVSTAAVGGFMGFGAYMHPAIIQDPKSFIVGYRRYMREVLACIRIGASYKWNWNNLTPEIHYANARICYDLCCKNGGVYIKFGQAVNQMETLIPDEWVEVFEPMQ